MIEHLAPSGRGEFEITDVLNHYIPERRPVHPGLRRALGGRRDGPEPAPRSRAGGRGPRGRAAAGAGPAAGRRIVTGDAVAPWAGARRRVCWSPAAPGSSARASSARCSARRDGTRIVGPRQAHLRRQRGEPATGARRPRAGRPADLRPRRHRRCAAPSGRSSPATDAVVNFAAESHVDRLDPRPRGVPADRGHRRPRPARRLSRREARPGRPAGALPPGLDRRGLRVGRDRSLGRDGRARAALTVRGRQGGRRAARPVVRRDPRPRRRGHPRVEHLRPVPPPREAHPAVHHERARRPAAAPLRRRAADPRLAVRRRSRGRRSITSCATAIAGETYNLPGGTELAEPGGRAAGSSIGSASPGRSSARSPIGPATTGAMRWTARRSRPSAGGHGSSSKPDSARPSTGSSPTRPWWRAIKAGDWDAYYERQYGRAGWPAGNPPRRRTVEAD